MPSKKASIPPDVFAKAQLSLLATEQATELTETSLLLSDTPPTILSRNGLAILNLTIHSQRTGLGGKTVIELGLDPAISGSSSADLPEHGIRTGDIVRVSEQPKGDAKKKERNESKTKGVEGVVTRVGERAIWVAAGKSGGDEDGDIPGGKLWL